MCELLAGAFTGGGCAGPPTSSAGLSNGMLSIYLSPDHFGTRGEFERIGREYLDWVLSARPVDPAEPVLCPATRRPATGSSAPPPACRSPPTPGRPSATPTPQRHHDPRHYAPIR